MSSRPYLEPGDVSPENAARVLAFLNAARSAPEIAAAVEIAGELDVGVRLAERILRRRDELGGFTDLAQVRAVPLIGPERFTEIVTTLSSQRVPGRPRTPFEQLADEVADLRDRVDRAGAGLPRRRLVLRTVEPAAFLGQPLSVVATIEDDGRPAVDVPITFVVTRGRLRASDGYATHDGHLVTARSDVEGIVRLTALPATAEELTPVQQAALTSMLALLDPSAATPADTLEGLTTMADQYAWEVNLPFRQAVDICVRDFRPMLLDTVNLRENLRAWTFFDTALMAFGPAEGNGEDGSSVAATATLRLRYMDWIPPFLEAFVLRSRRDTDLGDRIRAVAAGESDADRLISAIYDEAGSYVASRYGRVGAWVGRKVAETSIRSFVDGEFGQLPLDTRVGAFAALDGASKTMAALDATVIRGLINTRKDIQRDVNVKVSTQTAGISALDGRVASLETSVDDLPRTDALDALRTEMLGAIDDTRSDLTLRIDQRTSELDTRIARLRTDVDQMQPRLSQSVTQASLDRQLESRVTQGQLDAALSRKVDAVAFDGFRSTVDTRFRTVDTNINDLRIRRPPTG